MRRKVAAGEAKRALAACERRTHPYLARKGFPRLRLPVDRNGWLVVPAARRDGTLSTVQYISPDGEKRFHPRAAVKGAACRIGARSETIWCAEGFATALSVWAGLTRASVPGIVLACFSATNMADVAQAMASGRRRPVLCVADHDASGVGAAAARRTGLPWWMPPDVGMDANDFHASAGLDALARHLRRLTFIHA